MASDQSKIGEITNRVEFNHLRLAYGLSGDGLPLLLLHSGLCDRRMWDEQVADFSQRHLVARYDLRGFGESSNPPGPFAHHEDLRLLMDWLAIERATLVGLSVGGQVALQMALTYPARVSGLVLSTTIAGAATPTEEVKRLWRESDEAFAAGDLSRAIEIELHGWVDGPSRIASQVDSSVRTRVASMNTAIWERLAREAEVGAEDEFAPPVWTRLTEINVPTLLIVGDLDQSMTLASMATLATGIDRSETVVIEGTAHFPNLERPSAFNDCVLAFLHRNDL